MISSKSRKRSRIFLAIALSIYIFALLPTAIAVPIFSDTDIPASTVTGQPVRISVYITSDIPIRDVLLSYSNPSTGQLNYEFMNLTEGNETGGIWTFDIPAQPWEGTLEYSVKARDNTGSSSMFPASGTSAIEIIGDDPPKPFPWNWVIIIVFLAVALVVTELVFKPGFYRPTGRQRAKALEEEDRRLEQEESEKQD